MGADNICGGITDRGSHPSPDLESWNSDLHVVLVLNLRDKIMVDSKSVELNNEAVDSQNAHSHVSREGRKPT